MKPEHACTECHHSGQTMCLKDRVGWPFVGDWCSQYAERPEPQEKAVQTPEAIPSDH